MAHIKVQRRSMRPEEFIELRFGWLKRYVYEEKREITTFEIRDARQVAEETYEFYSDSYRSLKKGDFYFMPDGTAFIRAQARVPDEWEGREVWFSLKTAAEMVVQVNGVYVGGIDPNRDRVLLSPYCKSKDLHIDIVGYNRSKPDDERNPESLSVRGCRQIFEGGYLALVNDTVLSLVYDLELLLDAALSGSFDEDFSAMVIRELDSALNLIDFTHVTTEDAAKAASYIQTHIYDNKNYHGSGSVALIGHSHLDLAYYWRKIHTVQKNLRTILIQLRLMDRYPDFRYAHTQPYTYETLEKYYPAVFSELCEKIKTGQFEPAGVMYVEPDCNIPSAESLIRQCLYGQLYYREKFGLTVDNCWLPDVFGNSWILPQILLGCGVSYFVSNKMSTWNDTNRFPHNNFIWRGIDGSEVYACVPPTHFISWNAPSQIKENWDAYQDKDIGGSTMQMFGYGDGGSGCTEEMIELMHRFHKLSIMPQTEHMTGKDFLHKNFDNNRSLAVWDGELYLEMHRGTFTTKSLLKRMNRMLEFKFRDAEMLSVSRSLQGENYPAEWLRTLYKKFLVNQFHDILPGSHIAPVWRDTMEELTAIDRALDEWMGRGTKWYNTCNFSRSEPVFVSNPQGAMTRHGVQGSFQMPDGAVLDEVHLSADQNTDWFAFDSDVVDTPYYSLKFNRDGSFCSLFDRDLHREWVNGSFNELKIYRDCPGNYDAWDILPDYEAVQAPVVTEEPLHLRAFDGEAVEFTVTLRTGNSTWTRLIRLFRHSRAIEVENLVDWQEDHKLAKVVFDVNVLSRELICDTSAGFIRRETHRNTTWQQARFEVCHHKWCDMAESGGGVAFINEGKYGVGAKNSSVGLSLLRATERPDPDADRGYHDFCYLIFPHGGSFLNAQINRRAFEYNIPLLSADSFRLPVALPNELFLQAVKLSENGKQVIFRLSEQDGRRGTLSLGRKMIKMNLLEEPVEQIETLSYRPFELITLALNREEI